MFLSQKWKFYIPYNTHCAPSATKRTTTEHTISQDQLKQSMTLFTCVEWCTVVQLFTLVLSCIGVTSLYHTITTPNRCDI